MTVGTKVACVDDVFDRVVTQYYVALPKKGQVYTVRQMSVGVSPKGVEGEICVLVRELVNPRSNVAPFPERGFRIERFRELDELTETKREKRPEAITVRERHTITA